MKGLEELRKASPSPNKKRLSAESRFLLGEGEALRNSSKPFIPWHH